jgi:tetratricopeptide (TPR) repeat protein
MTCWTRSLSRAALLGLALCGSQSGAASGAEEQARALFAQARKAYGVADFGGALKLYTQAYQADPLPALLFDMAQCHRQLGQYERAIFFYHRFLIESHTRPANGDEVEEFIADLEKKQHAKEEADKAEAEANRQRQLDEARAAAARAEADAAARRTAELEADLRREKELEAALRAKPEDSTPLYKKWWVWAGTGVVVAGGVTTIVVVATLPQPVPGTLADINAR